MASFIVALTIYETSKRYDARAESFMRFAISAQKLRDQAVRSIFSKAKVDWSTAAQIEDAFHQLSTEYTDNHSHIDYDEHRIRAGKIRGFRKLRKKAFLVWNIWNLAVFALLSPVIIYMVFSFVLWLFRIPTSG